MICANHPERESVSFCQNCGKPLCTECSRPVGSGVFCEPCLAARLASAPPVVDSGRVYGTVPGAVPVAPGAANPVLAGLLGFIPGVGAMYNGQYAKGVVHLVVFTLLVSLTDHIPPFGILIAGWVFYQVFEAYHTARAIREGTPLPNPFGLNEVGERFGFGRAWPAGSSAPFAAPPVPPAASGASAGYPAANTAPYGSPVAPPVANAWDTPWQNYAPPPQAAVPPFVPVDAGPFPGQPPLSGGNSFPVGAVILIGLGLLFFFGSSGWFYGVRIERLLPFFLIGLGVWLFVRKMLRTGETLADDGQSNYQYRVLSALRGSVWVILVGVLFLLDEFNILSWGRSWPLFIILAGVMALLQRSMAPSTLPPAPGAYGYPGAYPAAAPVATPPSPASETPVTPVPTHREEGS